MAFAPMRTIGCVYFIAESPGMETTVAVMHVVAMGVLYSINFSSLFIIAVLCSQSECA